MRLKLLVVDEDISTLKLVSGVFSSLGVEVRTSRDSQEAATWIQQERFDGIFSELTMPKVDGFELIRQVRQSSWNRRTPVIILTGQGDAQSRAQAFEAGGTFFLHKPVDKASLIRLLNSTRGVMLEERRRYARIPFATEVVCQAGSRKITGQASNLSLEGMLFQGDGSLEPGNPLRLSFRLAGQMSTSEVEGMVVRIDERKRVGVRFTQMSLEDRQRIYDLVSSQMSPF